MDELKGKKIAVTGHTKGVGKEIYDICMFNGLDVHGFSRSNGWNLAEREGDKVISHLLKEDFDIVFNNAWFPKVQAKILTNLHTHWKDKEGKVVINTGSSTAYHPIGAEVYEKEKQYLRDYCTKNAILYPRKNKCRIHNVSLGWTKTEILADVDDNDALINPYEAALLIVNLARPQDYFISEILVNGKFLPEGTMMKIKDKAVNNVLLDLTKSRDMAATSS